MFFWEISFLRAVGSRAHLGHSLKDHSGLQLGSISAADAMDAVTKASAEGDLRHMLEAAADAATTGTESGSKLVESIGGLHLMTVIGTIDCSYFDLVKGVSWLDFYWRLMMCLFHMIQDQEWRNLFEPGLSLKQHSGYAFSFQRIWNTFAFSNLNDHCQLLNRYLFRPFLSHIYSSQSLTLLCILQVLQK